MKTLKNMNLGELQAEAHARGLSDEGTRAEIRTRIEEADTTPPDGLDALRAYVPPMSHTPEPPAEKHLEPVEEPVSPPESPAEGDQASSEPTLAERAQGLGLYVSPQWTDEQILVMIETWETAQADAASAPPYVPTFDDDAHLGYAYELASPRG